MGGYLLRNGSCLWIQVCMGLFGFGPSWFVKAYERFVLGLHNIEDKCYNLQNNPLCNIKTGVTLHRHIHIPVSLLYVL